MAVITNLARLSHSNAQADGDIQRPDLKLKTKIVTGKIKNNSDLSFQLINFSQGLFGILSIFRFCFQLLMSGLFPNYGGINSKAYFVKIKLTLES